MNAPRGSRWTFWAATATLLPRQAPATAASVVEREYALGRGRVDLLIVWPHGGRTRRFVVECKVRRDGLERTIRDGLEQTRGHMDGCGAESGHLIVFDRSPERTWEEKIFRREAPAGGAAPVTVRDM